MGERCVMLDLRRFEQPAQVGRDVADVVAESDSVSEDLATALLAEAPGGLSHVRLFQQRIQCHEQIRIELPQTF